MMAKKFFFMSFVVAGFLFVSPAAKAQYTSEGYYVDPNRGEKAYQRTAIIQANQVQSIYGNWGNFGWTAAATGPYDGTWPKGTSHGHIDEMTILVASQVVGADGNTYDVVDESYSEHANVAPDGHDYWWEPKPGYFNAHRSFANPDGTIDTTSELAHYSDPTTWPLTWPGKDASWDSLWDGYFGKAYPYSNNDNADDEGLYVMDDFWVNKFPYYPFTGDTTRGGLGLQAEERLFEWANPLAQNEVFIHSTITNVGDATYTRDTTGNPILFGAYADVNPGGIGSTNDVNSYDRQENMVLTHAFNDQIFPGLPYQNIKPGWMGWKFLESPGIDDDGIDNDRDGMVDESRSNPAEGPWAGATGPIYEASCPFADTLQKLYHVPPVRDGGVRAAFIATHDTAAFLSFFHLVSLDQVAAIQLKLWWPGDENGNWDPRYDDVGSDGIGPGDPGYTGPDPDGSQGNFKPDQGEANFGRLDKDESDQIGLTSFASPSYGSVWASNETQIWAQIKPGYFSNPLSNANLLWIFASGPFDMPPLHTERFSTVWLFGPDQTAVYAAAISAQNIYNYNYKFTTPPLQPRAHGVAGDHKVTIYWDNRAENSNSPVYGHNFEGYMVIRGTNAQLTEAQGITNAYGQWTYYEPIAQYDLQDGVKGICPIASGSELGPQYSSGIQFYYGNDSGLRYSFVDTNVTNGVTYYYVVLAYDRGYYAGMDTVLNDHGFDWVTGGVDRDLVPIEPSFSPFSFTFNNYNQLTGESVNTAIVTPNPRATNYYPGHTDADANGYIKQVAGLPVTGKVQVQIVDPAAIPNGREYQVSFASQIDQNAELHTTSYSIKDITADSVIAGNTTVPLDSTLKPSESWFTTVFDGMYLNFFNTQPSIDSVTANSGWNSSSQTNLIPTIAQGSGTAEIVGMNFSIKITGQPASNPTTITGAPQEYFIIIDNATHDTVNYLFKDATGSKHIDNGDELFIRLAKPDGTVETPWTIIFHAPANATPVLPQPGDEFNFVSNVPFGTSDVFQFTTTADSTKQAAKGVLDQVTVVPNPYMVAASWETPSALQGRGTQKLEFNHLPAKCTIRIFTQNGYLVKTIQHAGNVANGSEAWDLTSKDGLDVAFGIYLYQIDAPGIGQKIGTFAVIQ